MIMRETFCFPGLDRYSIIEASVQSSVQQVEVVAAVVAAETVRK